MCYSALHVSQLTKSMLHINGKTFYTSQSLWNNSKYVSWYSSQKDHGHIKKLRLLHCSGCGKGWGDIWSICQIHVLSSDQIQPLGSKFSTHMSTTHNMGYFPGARHHDVYYIPLCSTIYTFPLNVNICLHQRRLF